jgi:hypothetical protein|nr:hypothetical protein [uncultured Porphyromonas sp.]
MYAGEAGKDMELLARIDLCIQQYFKADLGKSIPWVQTLLTKLNPMHLLGLEL